MKLDERAERAATDLLERANARPIPTVDELTERRGRRDATARVLAVAAAIALVAGGVAVVTGRDDERARVELPAGLPVPADVTPERVEPPGMGVTFDLPSTWEWTGDTRGFDVAYVDGDESYASASRVATTDPMDADAFADLRHDVLVENLHADIGDTLLATIDGHEALVIDAEASGITFTEYDIDLGDGTWAIIAIGERAPVGHREVHEWIASTIAVAPSPLWSSAIDHPVAPLPVPTGVAPRSWAPAGKRFAIDLPATWTDAPYLSGFDVGMASTSGPVTFALASIVANGAGAQDFRENQLEGYDARFVDHAATVIDGYATRVIRYRIPTPYEPRLASLDVEYDIDLGDGTWLVVAIGTQGGSPADLIEWIRSTIRVTE